MKKLIAWILVCLLCATVALAEEQPVEEAAEAAAAPAWTEGRSPAQPYAHVPEVDLDKTMGYIMLYPRSKMPAERFCDVLEIYLPREDLALGEGSLTLCDADGELQKISFADAAHVELRKLEPAELNGLMWGSGVCLEVHLPVSLSFDESYYVLMDEGCFTAADGKLQSLPITYVSGKELAEQAWTPLLTGDFGIGGLYYSAAPARPSEEEEEEEAEAEATEAPAEDAEPKLEEPVVGDIIHFDLVMGGDAKAAVVYSENDSVYFETLEYAESGKVTGTVTGEDLSWGVVFLNEAGEVLDVVELK